MLLLRQVSRLTLCIALLAPVTPKVGVDAEAVVYLHEIALICYLPIVMLLRPSSLWEGASQRWFIAFVLLVAVISAFYVYVDVVEVKGWMRLVKLGIYACVPALVRNSNVNSGLWKTMVYVGMAALLANIALIYNSGQRLLGASLAFDAEALSGGLSGRFFNLSNQTLEITGRLSHGVWATYCAMLLAIASGLFFAKRIGAIAYLTFLALFMANLALSISREGLLVALAVSLGFLVKHRLADSGERLNISMPGVVVLLAVVAGFLLYIGETQIGQKVAYTSDALRDGLFDANVASRLSTWRMTWSAATESLWRFLFGFGYNMEMYARALDDVASGTGAGVYAHVPESLLVTAFAFAGLGGVVLILCFGKGLYIDFKRSAESRSEKVFMGLFLIGIGVTNVLSGATAFSDLVMLHLFLAVGMWMCASDGGRRFARQPRPPSVRIGRPEVECAAH